MKTKQLFLILFLILVSMTWFSCNPSSNYPDAPVNIDQQELLNLVNEVRQSGCNCGGDYFPPVNPVVWNDTLEHAAQIHSDDMYDEDYFSHTGSDGSSAGDRISDAGYDWSTYGENIAAGYTSEQAVIQGWLDSDGHCRNIMNGNFTEMGIATKGPYWTQVFATK